MAGQPRVMPSPLVIFEVETHLYAISIDHTRELLRAPTIVPFPRAPAVVEGIINIRGRLTPVLDLRKRFNLPARPPGVDDYIVVVHAGPRLAGFRVDRVLDVTRVRPEDIEAAAAITPRADYLAGVAKLPDGMVLIHDPATFLSAAEAGEVDRALDHPAAPAP
jgi:purine-binding chemotaxis protein CheW